jgi:hypothetical protein
MTFSAADTDTDLGDDVLATDGKIAAFVLGSDTPKNRGRVRALMCQILPVEHRMPSCLLGGQRTSRKSWIRCWFDECREREEARARADAEGNAHASDAADARYRRRIGRPRRQPIATHP